MGEGTEWTCLQDVLGYIARVMNGLQLSLDKDGNSVTKDRLYTSAASSHGDIGRKGHFDVGNIDSLVGSLNRLGVLKHFRFSEAELRVLLALPYKHEGETAESLAHRAMGAGPAPSTKWFLDRVGDGGGSKGLSAGDWTVGRAENNKIHLNDPAASGHHACIHVDEYGCTLTDLYSKNGTVRNGTPLAPNVPVRLQPGDELKFSNGDVFVARETDRGKKTLTQRFSYPRESTGELAQELATETPAAIEPESSPAAI